LHHYFSEKIQKHYPICYDDSNKCRLHPEWATGGEYKKRGNEYVIDDNDGTKGFIDFTIGNYSSLELGLEFKVMSSWKFQSIVFDYMKLLDCTNPLPEVISFSIIYRDKELSGQLTLNRINETIRALKTRLDKRLATTRPFLFWIIEITSQEKRFWYCNDLNTGFIEIH
jgi:hypothetical protein